MPDDTKPENEKKEEESNKPQPKKKRRRINLYSATEKMMKQAMKQANLANDMERQLRASYDIARFMEASTWTSREMEGRIEPTLTINDVFGPGTTQWALEFINERINTLFRDPINDALSQIETYAACKIEDLNRTLNNALPYRHLEDLLAPFSEKLAWIDSLSFNPVEEAIEKIKGSMQLNLSSFLKISSEINVFYKNLPDVEIVSQDSQTIAYDGNTYDISEINSVVEESLEVAGFFSEKRISQKIFYNLISILRKFKDVALQKIVWIIIGCIISKMVDYSLDVTLGNISNALSKPQNVAISKFVQKEIPKNVDDKNVLKNLRFVNNFFLDVRIINYERSKLLWTLRLGDVVRVMQKKKNWTLIQWKDDENDLMITGWVFTRYLKKFKY